MLLISSAIPPSKCFLASPAYHISAEALAGCENTLLYVEGGGEKVSVIRVSGTDQKPKAETSAEAPADASTLWIRPSTAKCTLSSPLGTRGPHHAQSRVPPCPHAAGHPLGFPSSHQPLPTCSPSRGSQRAALGSNLRARLIWGIIKMRYLIQLKYRQQTKPSCTRALQGLIPLPLQWKPPGKLPPRRPVPAHTVLDVLGRAGEAFQKAPSYLQKPHRALFSPGSAA